MKDKKQKWNDAYKETDFNTATAASVLIENTHLLPLLAKEPSTNKIPLDALDLACGRAGNAQCLANLGFAVDAIDISSVVIEGLEKFVDQENLNIKCILRDIENDGLPLKKYDVIVVSYFLNRDLFSQIKAALKPNGLLFYQTWSQLNVDEAGPKNQKFRLASGELLELCSGLKPIMYREDGLEGDLTEGLRNEAVIIAKNT